MMRSRDVCRVCALKMVAHSAKRATLWMVSCAQTVELTSRVVPSATIDRPVANVPVTF